MSTLEERGKRLFTEREKLKLTAVFVSKQLTIARNTLANYEAGLTDIPSETLIALDKLGFDIPYILFGTRTKSLSSAKFENIDGKEVFVVEAGASVEGEPTYLSYDVILWLEKQPSPVREKASAFLRAIIVSGLMN